MNRHLLALYHRLPGRGQSIAASLRGWYLRYRREGTGSELLIEETLERDRWSAAQWHAWRGERLAYVLQRAATRVPYYREHWEARRRRGDGASWEVLANWPILDKDTVRTNPRAFLDEDCNPRRMFHEQTSGTTGPPVDLWRTRASVAAFYAISAARTRRWDAIPDRARWAHLGGQLMVPLHRRRPPFWVWNAAMRQLYLSSFHLAHDLIPHHLDALVRYRVTYLSGYPSSLTALAQEVLRLGRQDLRMAAVYTNGEPLLPAQREMIAAAFQCPVRETYGMAEMVAAGSECAAGRLHQWPEFGHIEVMEDGELICTGLLNPDMPLIRYRVGDRGRPAPPPTPESCACGRGLPAMGAIDGRTTDLLLTKDGQKVFGLNPVFSGLPVRHLQVAQDRLDLVRVRVAPAPGFTDAMERTIVERLQEQMGDVHVIVDRVDEVPRTANGRLRTVVCNLSPAERAAALSGGAAVAS